MFEKNEVPICYILKSLTIWRLTLSRFRILILKGLRIWCKKYIFPFVPHTFFHITFDIEIIGTVHKNKTASELKTKKNNKTDINVIFKLRTWCIIPAQIKLHEFIHLPTRNAFQSSNSADPKFAESYFDSKSSARWRKKR